MAGSQLEEGAVKVGSEGEEGEGSDAMKESNE